MKWLAGLGLSTRNSKPETRNLLEQRRCYETGCGPSGEVRGLHAMPRGLRDRPFANQEPADGGARNPASQTTHPRGSGAARRRLPQPVPALRSGSLHAGLPSGGHTEGQGAGDGAHRAGCLHQLRFLRHGLSLRGHPVSRGQLGHSRQAHRRQVRQLRRAAAPGVDSRLCRSVQIGSPHLRGAVGGHEAKNR